MLFWVVIRARRQRSSDRSPLYSLVPLGNAKCGSELAQRQEKIVGSGGPPEPPARDSGFLPNPLRSGPDHFDDHR